MVIKLLLLTPNLAITVETIHTGLANLSTLVFAAKSLLLSVIGIFAMIVMLAHETMTTVNTEFMHGTLTFVVHTATLLNKLMQRRLRCLLALPTSKQKKGDLLLCCLNTGLLQKGTWYQLGDLSDTGLSYDVGSGVYVGLCLRAFSEIKPNTFL